jgi:hypothetical protein
MKLLDARFHPGALHGAAGVLLLGLAVPLAAGLAPHWRAQAEAQRTEARAAETVSTRQAAERAQRGAAEADLAQQRTPWPEAAASPRRAVALDTLARRQGLQLQQVRQQLDATQQLQVAMVGSGSYGAIRRFVERALAADAALALDRLRLQRDDAEAETLRFELQWSLLQQPLPPGSPVAVAGAREPRP